jgi:mannosyltransferase OCH1-like enzyme
MTIPKIIHYVWVGPRNFPKEAAAHVDEWKVLHPDWEFMFWDERNIDFSPRFMRQASGVRAYNRVCNYARLAALRRYGGFYLDHDVKLLKTLDSLRDNAGVLGFQTEKDEFDLVNNAVFGAVPDHPFVCRALAELDKLDGGFDWGSKTGPGHVSRLLRESDQISPRPEPYVASGMTLYPPRYFYPYPWNKAFTPDCITPDTYAVHFWEHSWKGRRTLVHRLKKRARRILTLISPDLMSGYVRARDAAAKAGGWRAPAPRPARREPDAAAITP